MYIYIYFSRNLENITWNIFCLMTVTRYVFWLWGSSYIYKNIIITGKMSIHGARRQQVDTYKNPKIRPYHDITYSGWAQYINQYGPKSIYSGHYTASINSKKSIATITQSRSLKLLTTKTILLHMLYYMNWLTHDFWTRTGGWEFDRSHGAGTSSPSHWRQRVEEQAPKPLGWIMCFLLMTFVPVQKVCVNIYTYICIYMLFYMSSVFFGLPIVSS